MYRRNGAPSGCFGVDVDDIKRQKSLPNASDESIVTPVIILSSFGNTKNGFGSNLTLILLPGRATVNQ